MANTLPREGMEEQEDTGLLRGNGDSLLHNKATAATKDLRNNSTTSSSSNTTRPSSNTTNNNTNNRLSTTTNNNNSTHNTVSLMRATPCRKASNASATAPPKNTLSNTQTAPESERPCWSVSTTSALRVN